MPKRTYAGFLIAVCWALLLTATGYVMLAPQALVAAPARATQQTMWTVDRLDDPALPTGTACTAADDDCTLRGAIDQATDGDTIQLTVPGTITLTQGALVITKSITITSPSLAEHVIDGAGSYRIFPINGNRTVILEQLTLQNGRADEGGAVRIAAGTLTMTHVLLQNNVATGTGGALFASGRSAAGIDLYLRNVQFRNNRAQDGFQSGGAIHADAFGNGASVGLYIDDGHFENNVGGPAGDGYGGAISATTLDNGSSMALEIRRTQFISNTTGDYGGALYVQPFNRDTGGASSMTVTIEDSAFLSNTVQSEFSGYGGGAYLAALESGSELVYTIRNTQFSDNLAGYTGGGLSVQSYNRNSGGATVVNGTVVSSTFAGNRAERGGGVYLQALDARSQLSLAITDTTFISNTATRNGGGLLLQTSTRDDFGRTTSLLLVNGTTFVGNRALDSNGGAIHAVTAGSSGIGESSVRVVNSTLSGNHAEEGAALYATASGVTTTTNTIALVNVTAFDNGNSESSAIRYSRGGNAQAELTLRNSILAGGQGTVCNLGNMTATGANNLIDDESCGADSDFRLDAVIGLVPQLADNGGPTLTHSFYAGSNALDVLTPAQCTDVDNTTAIAVDQRGEPRPFNTNCDVGALEVQTSDLPDAPDPEPDPDPDPDPDPEPDPDPDPDPDADPDFVNYLPALEK